MSETRTIRTVLELNTTRFQAAASAAARDIQTLGREMESVRGTTDRLGGVMLGIGGTLAAGLGASVKAAMDWESAWAGVRKTVDGSSAELAQVEAGLRGLTKTLPASHTEIAAVAEAAGQLGIKAKDVVSFTETMINLGETTNLTAEDAATGLARFSNIMGTSSDDVDRLGAALVGLGNNYETTEAEILAMAMRLAGTANQIGITEGQVLGLAAAMSSVGIEAEAGGTAMSLGLSKIQSAVDSGGKKLEAFAKVAGMSSTEFAKAWSADPASGLNSVVVGLQRIQAEGGNVTSTLADLGIKGIRERDTFLRLAGAADLLGRAMAQGNTEFDRNTALVAEAAKRYETAESKIAIAKNQLVELGIEIGGQVLPAVATLAEKGSDIISWASSLPGPVKSAATALGGLTAAVGVLGGAALLLVPRIADTVRAFQTLQTHAPRVSSAMGRVGKAAGVASAAFLAFRGAAAIADQFKQASASADEMALKLINASKAAGINAASVDKLVEASSNAGFTIRGVGDALSLVNANAFTKGIEQLTAGVAGFDTTFGVAAERLGELDRAMSSLLTSGNRAEFEATFRAAADSAREYGFTVEDLIAQTPTLRQELTAVANQMGLQDDPATLAKIALGEYGDAAGVAKNAAGELKDGLHETTGATDEQVESLDKLTEGLTKAASVMLGSRDAARGFEEAIDAAAEATAKYGSNLDRGTEEGRKNEESLDAIANAALRYADSVAQAGGSVEEVAGIVARGREEFLKAAAAKRMDAGAAEELADKLRLIPSEVTTTVTTNTDDVKVKIDNTKKWIEGALTGPPTEVTVTADTVQAHARVDEFKEKVKGLGLAFTVNGDIVPAQKALEILQAQIKSSDGTVTINGQTVPAERALDQMIAEIDRGNGTLTISGNNGPAIKATEEAKRKADSTTGQIKVGANAGAARKTLADLSKDRHATIYVTAKQIGAFVYDLAARLGRAHGGWIGKGLNSGGWVPGPYPGPGVDNILWPLNAGGRTLRQPLAGGEYVVNAQAARQWGPALEAINAGRQPATTQTAVTQNIHGPDAYEVAKHSMTLLRMERRREVVALA